MDSRPDSAADYVSHLSDQSLVSRRNVNSPDSAIPRQGDNPSVDPSGINGIFSADYDGQNVFLQHPSKENFNRQRDPLVSICVVVAALWLFVLTIGVIFALILAGAALGYKKEITPVEEIAREVSDLQMKLLDLERTVLGDGSCSISDGWISHRDKCYRFETVRETWADARAECEAREASLAYPGSIEEWIVINTIANGRPTWLGATDVEQEGVWRDSNGDEIEFLRLPWKRAQPDNAGASHHCLAIDTESEVTDEDCADMVRQYICVKTI